MKSPEIGQWTLVLKKSCKFLIFVICGPEKPNHPSSVSVMQFPWS